MLVRRNKEMTDNLLLWCRRAFALICIEERMKGPFWIKYILLQRTACRHCHLSSSIASSCRFLPVPRGNRISRERRPLFAIIVGNHQLFGATPSVPFNFRMQQPERVVAAKYAPCPFSAIPEVQCKPATTMPQLSSSFLFPNKSFVFPCPEGSSWSSDFFSSDQVTVSDLLVNPSFWTHL